jgi:hypothetical protein
VKCITKHPFLLIWFRTFLFHCLASLVLYVYAWFYKFNNNNKLFIIFALWWTQFNWNMVAVPIKWKAMTKRECLILHRKWKKIQIKQCLDGYKTRCASYNTEWYHSKQKLSTVHRKQYCPSKEYGTLVQCVCWVFTSQHDIGVLMMYTCVYRRAEVLWNTWDQNTKVGPKKWT